MPENTDLLQFVHKNAEMGRETIPKVLELTKEEDLRRALSSQLREYEEISAQAERAIRSRGKEPTGTGPVSETMSDLMLRCKTAADKSPSHLAEMMIKGSTVGTIQMTRRIRDYKEQGDGEAIALADRLLKTEENNIQQMKSFL